MARHTKSPFDPFPGETHDMIKSKVPKIYTVRGEVDYTEDRALVYIWQDIDVDNLQRVYDGQSFKYKTKTLAQSIHRRIPDAVHLFLDRLSRDEPKTPLDDVAVCTETMSPSVYMSILRDEPENEEQSIIKYYGPEIELFKDDRGVPTITSVQVYYPEYLLDEYEYSPEVVYFKGRLYPTRYDEAQGDYVLSDHVLSDPVMSDDRSSIGQPSGAVSEIAEHFYHFGPIIIAE